MNSPSKVLLILACGALTACDDAKSDAYRATYDVPVPAELAAAATYDVARVEWSVDGGTAELRYDLPLGLVGKTVGLSFKGSVDATGTSANLTGAAGTALCTIGPSAVDCNETMAGLLPLEPDLAAVESLAAAEYAGPAADRVEVAKRFAGDPIGVVHIDLTHLADDDSSAH